MPTIPGMNPQAVLAIWQTHLTNDTGWRSVAYQPTKSLNLPARGGSCAHFDRVVILDELLSNRRQYCTSATTSAPTLSSNGWFPKELIYLLH
jgi:hypothetical protein